MATTIMVSEGTRDQLGRLKDLYATASMDATIQRLLREATPDAQALFNRRKRRVKAVCEKYGLTTLIAFGSRVREDRTPASDLDLVTIFPQGSTLFELVNAQEELSDAFSVPVDLGTLPSPGDRLRSRIDKEGVRLL